MLALHTAPPETRGWTLPFLILTCSLAVLGIGCDFGGSDYPNAPPTRPTPPAGVRPKPRPGPTAEEQKAVTSINTQELDAARKRHNTAVAFELIKRRVNECGTDAACLTTVDTAIGRLKDEDIGALVPAVNAEHAIGVRAEVIRVLAMRGVETAIEELLIALEDKDPQIIATSATALGDLGDIRAIPALVELLRSNTNEEVRIAILRGLGRFNSRTAVDAIAAAQKGASPATQAVIAAALSRTRHPAATRPLSLALQSESPLVRLEAINGLSTIADATALKALQSTASNDHDAAVKKRAAEAIAEIKSARQRPTPEKKP